MYDAHVLVLASLRKLTGNAMTAQRLAATIPSRRCSTLDVSAVADCAMLERLVRREDVSVVVGIHAFRAGRLLVNSQVPYVIVLGGTDMNVHLREPDKRAIMEKALARAGSIVAFNAELLRTLLEAMPAIARQKTFLAAQATRVSVTRPLPADRAQLVRAAFDLRDGERLLLLPAGLRPVKDVCFLASALATWHATDSSICLRIVGPALDAKYAEAARSELHALLPSRAVRYLGALPQPLLHAAMAEAVAVLNSSKSEGMCNSLLEAMLIGTPVLARANAGNVALLRHLETGLLYESAGECVRLAQQLLADDALSSRLAAAAAAHVRDQHSAQREAEVYLRALNQALSPS